MAPLVADQQAHRTVHRRFATGHEPHRMLYGSSPLLSCAVGPVVTVLLAAVGVMTIGTALVPAAKVAVASLYVWGCVGVLRRGGGSGVTLFAGLLDAVIGVTVTLVKAAAGH